MPKPKRKTDYTNKSILITGGSRGLGLIMARKLAKQGAKLMLVARSEEELVYAYQELRSITSDIHIFSADLSEPQEIKKVISETQKTYGRIDILIHNAGIVDVGPIETMTSGDFNREMDIHFWAAFYLSQEILPLMKEQGGGRIINISSVGGLIPVPHMLAYSASKFALVGFSEGLGIELDRYAIQVTTVCPGLLRTGSSYQALFKGDPVREKRWFTLLSSLPFISMDADRAAQQILRASSKGQSLITLSLPAQIATRMHAIFPNTWSSISKMVAKSLPDSVVTTIPQPGYEVEDVLPDSVTYLNRKAAQRNNEAAS